MRFIHAGIIFLYLVIPAFSEGWDTEDQAWIDWFQTSQVQGCCNHRDAYVADDVVSDGNGGWLAVITDGSGNEKYNKPAIPNGTKIPVPFERFKKDPTAPGHGVIFLEKSSKIPPENRQVFCYFPPVFY